MRIIKSIFLLLVIAPIIQSCHKTIIVVPSACMSLNKSTVHLQDTLVINNCSKSEEAYVFILDSAQASKGYKACTGNEYTFNRKSQLSYVFSNTGTYHIYLRAINQETDSPIEMDSTIVQVLP